MCILRNNKAKLPVRYRIEQVPLEVPSEADGRGIMGKMPESKCTLPGATKPRTSAAGATEPTPTISRQDWESWGPIFQEASRKFGVAYNAKAVLEDYINTKRVPDGYNHRGCSLRARGGGSLALKLALRSGPTPRLTLLSALFTRQGHQSLLVTRTSLAHHDRQGCDPWTRFSADSKLEPKLEPCCKTLVADVPEEGELSQYEHELRVQKRDWQLEKQRSQAARKLAQAQKEHEAQTEGLRREIEALETASRRLADKCAALSAEEQDLRGRVDQLLRTAGRKRARDEGEGKAAGSESGGRPRDMKRRRSE